MIFLNILENIFIKKGIFAKYSYRQSWRKKRCKMLTLFFQCLLSPFPQLLFVPWINFTVIRPFIQFLEATKYNLYYRELSPPIGKSHKTGGMETCLKKLSKPEFNKLAKLRRLFFIFCCLYSHFIFVKTITTDFVKCKMF